MDTVGLIGLLKIELPDATVRLCDGGFIEFDGETYTSKDPVFGTIASIEALAEGVGDEIPALELTLFPLGPAGALSQPGFQTSRVRFWMGEYDDAAGTLVGTPDLMFDGQIDQTVMRWGASRELAITVVSTAERLFQRNSGNSLNDTWHQSVWPGELGHKNATGLSIPVAWGAESPPRNYGTGGKAKAAGPGQGAWW